MTVADSSAIIAFLLKEPKWTELKKYLGFVKTVELAKKEFYNALWKAARLGRVPDPWETLDVAKEYFDCCAVFEDQDELLDESLELALKTGLTVYDSLFVVLSLRSGEELITLDKKQADVARSLGVKVLPQ